MLWRVCIALTELRNHIEYVYQNSNKISFLYNNLYLYCEKWTNIVFVYFCFEISNVKFYRMFFFLRLQLKCNFCLFENLKVPHSPVCKFEMFCSMAYQKTISYFWNSLAMDRKVNLTYQTEQSFPKRQLHPYVEL